MGFIKRAFLYVTRKKGKSVLLLIIFLVMATFVLTGLSIEKASQVTQSSLRQALGGEFKVIPDYSENNPYFKMDQDNEGNVSIYTERPVTKDMIDTVMRISGIESYDATAQCLVNTKLNVFPGNVPVKEQFKDMVYARIVAGTENNRYFKSGTLKLTEGGHITTEESNIAVISKDLAEKNSLKIGDFIPLQSDGTTDVQIIGIYEIAKSDQIFANVTSYEKLENQIFTDLNTFGALIPSQTAGFDTATFKVNDPAQLESIISQMKDLSSIDWRAFTVETNNQTYMDAAAPLLKLQTLVTAILIIIVVVSAIILSLILTMWAKSRIHETGVFLSLGIGKNAIIGQYLAEALMIAVFAFGLSFFTSNAIASGLANELLQQNVQTSETPTNGTPYDTSVKDGAGEVEVRVKDDTAISNTVPQEGGQAVEAEVNKSPANMEQINVAIGLDNMVQLYLIGFAIIILSVGASSAVVMRLKPREILSKMS